MKVLNLYAGIGGNRKLWTDVDVTAVEFNPDIAAIYCDFFPQDKMVVGDAHAYLLDHFAEFDFIWASPPCQSHSVCNHFLEGQGIFRYPDMKLWQEILFLKHFFKGKYCVENVKSYYDPIIPPQESGRHYLWANFYIRPINYEHDVVTMNRSASKETQRKAIIREAQIPELIDLHGLKDFKLANKRQVLRNCVIPRVGLHILNESKRDIQPELFR